MSTTFKAPSLVIGERRLGPGEPVFVIAEGSINHNGSIRRAQAIIAAAAVAGADAVKFQKRNLAEVYQPKVLADPNQYEQKYQYLLPLLKEFELPDEAFIVLEKYATERGIIFMVNGWDKKSVDWIEANLAMPLYKVGSPDMTNDELLEHIAATVKPMIVSTGMSRQEEVDHCVALLKRLRVSLALLHANNTYPAPFDEINLAYLDVLKKFGVPVGYSGHERGIAVSLAAVARGACIIERHLTVDKTLPGPDHQASLLPDEFSALVAGIREVERSIGQPVKRLSKIEQMNREILAKSVVAATFIPDGTTITRAMLTTKSPAKGLSPQRLNELVGLVAQRDVFAGDVLTEDDIRGHEVIAQFNPRGIRWQWGPVVRFNDFESYDRYQPSIFEFHLSDKDLEAELPRGTWPQQLIVHAPEYMHRTYLDPAAEDREALATSRATLARTLELTKRLSASFHGTPKLVIHPGGITLTPHQRPERLRAIFAETMMALKQQSTGVEILPENLPPRPWVFGGEWVGNIFLAADEIRQWLDATDHNLCFDTSHAALACNARHTDLTAMVTTLASYIHHLHLSDGAGIGEEGLQIGEGTIDWGATLVPLAGYRHTMVPEIWQGHLHGGRGFLLAMDRLRPFMK